MELLDPLKIPLTGTTLIEASAGTGKTFTITTLFLRLLIEKEIPLDKILVVTFTIAATEELRIKLRARVVEAIEDLKRNSDSEETDEVLSALLKHGDRDSLLQLLSDVAARLDELAVYTIDAMCLRVLQDFSFESGLPLRMEFIADDYEIRKQVIEDYWRRVIGGNDRFAKEELVHSFKSPAGLLKTLTPVLRAKTALCLPDVNKEMLEKDRSQLTRRFFRIVSTWEEVSEEVIKLLRDSNVLHGNKYRVKSVDQIIAALNDMVKLEALPSSLTDKFKLVTETYLSGAIKKGKVKPEHVFFRLCDDFDAELKEYVSRRKAAVLIEARDSIARDLENYKSGHGILHFEDLRDRLDSTLQGGNGHSLAAKIRQMWPYAMIDEFQDTDPQQNRIFKTIYTSQDNGGFFQIGDPKQAIYSFRGADVFTYMAAARRVDHRFTLGTNWRSSSHLVTGVNAVFEHPQKPFVFDEDIKFRSVDAAGKVDSSPLTIANQSVVPLQFHMLECDDPDQPIDSTDATKSAALNCAYDIAALLLKGKSGHARIGDKPVRAANIAVLVRTHDERKTIQAALYTAGVNSVALSTEPVFKSPEALELSLVLKAIAQPGKIGVIRRALVTEMIGYSAHQLDALNKSENDWDTLFTRFVGYRDTWEARGFMAAAQSMVVEMQVTQNLLGYPDGERRMTNLLQLIELLQFKSRELPSHDELLLWLDKQFESQVYEDEQLLRLESDEDLVQVVTIHKSKGLEYPIVYLPFPWRIGANRSDEIALFHDRKTLQAMADFGSSELSISKELEAEEGFAENIRLLYVALTRAKHLCVMCWGNIKKAEASALAYLVHQSKNHNEDAPVSNMKGRSESEIIEDLQGLAAKVPQSIAVITKPALQCHYQNTAEQEPLCFREFAGSIDRQWKITSYTGLLSGEDNGLPDHDTVATLPEDEDVEQQASIEESLGDIANLPAGARTGEMIHDLFENIEFTSSEYLPEAVSETLKRYGQLGRRGLTQPIDWTQVVVELINNSLDTTLDAESGFRLRDIEAHDRLNEMEFFFSIKGVNSKAINTVLADSEQYRDTAKGLSFPALKGLMRGFIDMVARKNGRYYIVDYKSNLLGDQRRFYSRDNMQQAIRSHRYDLQYLIYTVALHRYLKNRMPEYQYERDFGGVFYLFVRGMQVGSKAGVWFDRPPITIVEALDQCFDPELEQA